MTTWVRDTSLHFPTALCFGFGQAELSCIRWDLAKEMLH